MTFSTKAELLNSISKSKFRSSFKLKGKELEYAKSKGLETLRQHAIDFIEKRLKPAFPENDGSQTPMKNHPVFIAQHATATCCRGCIEKWHKIKLGRELDEAQINYIADIICWWLEEQLRLNQ